MSIPMYKTHQRPVEPAKAAKPDAPPESTLRTLLLAGSVDVVKTLVAEFGLPFEVRDGQLVDKLQGTSLWLHRFVTVDAEMLSLKDEIMKLSKHQDEVLIVGETGTGKELLSRALIGNREGKSLAINCAGLPDALVESELFGYVRGSFTGAEGDRMGLMASAKDGLLFLDEIGELPLQAQGKLLRALQERMIRRVGSTKEEPINCRVVCATNRNLYKMVEEGTFRKDLLARISTFEFNVKPLRQRMCDVEPICKSIPDGSEFYKEHGNKLHDGKLSLEYNVRSLLQHIRRHVVLGRVISTTI